MAQSDADLTSSSLSSIFYSTLNALRAAVRSMWSGNSAPLSPVKGQWWLDTDTPSATSNAVNVYDGSNWLGVFTMNTSTHALTFGTDMKASIDARVHEQVIPLGAISASADRFIRICTSSTVVVNAYILNGTTIAADGSNYWSFQIRNITGAVNLLSSVVTTAASAITADTAFALAPNQNLSPSDGAVLQLQITKTGSASAFDAEAAFVLTYKVTT